MDENRKGKYPIERGSREGEWAFLKGNKLELMAALFFQCVGQRNQAGQAAGFGKVRRGEVR